MPDILDPNFIEAERQRLLQELEERKEGNKGNHDPYNFNNLYMWLNDKEMEAGGWRRQLAIKADSMDKPFEANPKNSERMTQLASRREFFRIVDETVERFGLAEKIQGLLNKYHKRGEYKNLTYNEARDAEEELEETLKPVYVELRLMGFNHFDLI